MVPVLNADAAKQQRIEEIVNEYPYIEIFTLNTAEIEKDDATVDAFKRFMDKKMLNEGVDRYEIDDTLLYGMKINGGEDTTHNLLWPSVKLEHQPWFERYFSSVYSYEKGFTKPEDTFERIRREKAQGWNKRKLRDQFTPKK